MGILQGLKLSNVEKRVHVPPVVHRRNKLVDKLHEQLMLAKATAEGKQYEVAGVRRIKNAETGEIKKQDIMRQVKRWWFVADDGKLMLQIRYGTKVIQLAKGKSSIEVGAMDKLIPTIELLKKATLEGELDGQIEAVIE